MNLLRTCERMTWAFAHDLTSTDVDAKETVFVPERTHVYMEISKLPNSDWSYSEFRGDWYGTRMPRSIRGEALLDCGRVGREQHVQRHVIIGNGFQAKPQGTWCFLWQRWRKRGVEGVEMLIWMEIREMWLKGCLSKFMAMMLLKIIRGLWSLLHRPGWGGEASYTEHAKS